MNTILAVHDTLASEPTSLTELSANLETETSVNVGLDLYSDSRPFVVAVVVTYQPEISLLENLLDNLSSQVKYIIIVDNGSITDTEIWITERQTPSITAILLGENRGIAFAHNLGIKWAQAQGAGFVLLMDQDSIPSPDMVEKLLLALVEGKAREVAIAAGPACVDMRTGKKSLFVIESRGILRRWREKHTLPKNGILSEVCFLISSGTLINLNFLQRLGGMRANYFIDHVDTEWCFRARANGYVLLGVPAAEMLHTLGDKVKNVWFFGMRQVAYHSPLRDYYMFRNTILMFHDVKLTLVWKIYLLWRLVQFSGYFLVFTPQRRQRFYCMALGVAHGVLGKRGKIDLITGQCTKLPTSDLDP